MTTHIDSVVRQTVPKALDDVGMSDLARRVRGLDPVTGPDRARVANDVLRHVLGAIEEARVNADTIVKVAGKVSKDAVRHRDRLLHAKCAIVAASRVCQEAATKGVIVLN